MHTLIELLHDQVLQKFSLSLGFTSSPHDNEDRIRNCQAVIDSLANEVLEIDLSHIEGRDIVAGNIAAIANLLEIFMGLLEYIYEELEREDNQYNKENGELIFAIFYANCFSCSPLSFLSWFSCLKVLKISEDCFEFL